MGVGISSCLPGRGDKAGVQRELGLAFPEAAELPVGPGFQLSPQWLPLTSHCTIQ